jgi:hypothetical protein
MVPRALFTRLYILPNLTNGHNNPECLPLASLSGLMLCNTLTYLTHLINEENEVL